MTRAAPLWHLLARWLGRQEAPREAVHGGPEGLALDPDSRAGHLTLAELYHAQKKDAEAAPGARAGDPARSPGARALRDPGPLLRRAQGATTGLAPSSSGSSRSSRSTPGRTTSWAARRSSGSPGTRPSRHLRRAVELDPDQDGAWAALAFAYEQQKKPERGGRRLPGRVEANPDNPRSATAWASCSCASASYRDATEEYQGSPIRPQRPARLDKLGAVLYEQKSYDEAIDGVPARADPRAGQPAGPLLPRLGLPGRRPGGRGPRELRRGPAHRPAIVDARLQLGFLHSRAKRYDEAVRVLTEAANSDPSRPEIFLYLGMAHYRAARYEQAVRAYEEGLALDEAHKDLHFQLGVAFEKMGRFDQAVAEFRRVIVLDPKHAEAYNYVGYMFAEKGVRLDEAQRLIQKALELEPENGYYIDSLGWAYYQQGRYYDAVRELRRAVELTRGKEDAVIYDHLGEAYLKAGDEPAALSAWEKSLELDPTNETVRQKVMKTRQRQEGRK